MGFINIEQGNRSKKILRNPVNPLKYDSCIFGRYG